MLKALGINVTDEIVAKIEMLLPQVPSVAHDIVRKVQSFITESDIRLSKLESRETDRFTLLQVIEEKQSIIDDKLTQLIELGSVKSHGGRNRTATN